LEALSILHANLLELFQTKVLPRTCIRADPPAAG
jgi:hypothetical protein